MKYLLFPGCCCSDEKTTSRAYKESLDAIWTSLAIQTEELDDWNCCGATTYMAIDEYKAYGMAARNLARAEKQLLSGDLSGNSLVTPCSACYMVLNKTRHYINDYAEIGDTVRGALGEAGLSYEGKINIRHPLDIFVNDFGLSNIREKVVNPLSGLKVACYYGCLLLRPYAEFDDPDNPTSLEYLMKALGADYMDWPLKTRCCGGSLMGTLEEVGKGLNHILLKDAIERGADIITTTCPFCQFNLECFQDKLSAEFNENINIPVVFFSQLMGLALGLPEKKLGFNRLFIPFDLAGYQKGGAYVQR